jgi:hypothetical protein
VIAALARRPTLAGGFGRRLARAAEVGIWGALVVLVALGVALPEESLSVVLGAAGGLAAALIVLRPVVAIPLLLIAVPFGSRASADPGASDTTALSVGAVEAVAAGLAVAWLAKSVRERRVDLRGGVLVGALASMALACVSGG